MEQGQIGPLRVMFLSFQDAFITSIISYKLKKKDFIIFSFMYIAQGQITLMGSISSIKEGFHHSDHLL